MTSYHTVELKILRAHPDAILPEYQSPGASCFDLHTISEGLLNHSADSALIFDTGLHVEIPPGWTMLILSRSGHGFNKDVRLSNCVGVIDSDYRGELKVKLRADAGSMKIKKGDRIAQAMLVHTPVVKLSEVDTLTHTERGEGGFGSTDLPTNPRALIVKQSARRQAYEDYFHKVAATIPYPRWCEMWAKGETPVQKRAAQPNAGES